MVPPLISWKSKKQSIVSRSAAEAEYRSICTTVCELKWINYLLDLQIPSLKPVNLSCDNEAAVDIARNLVFHEKDKTHRDIVSNCKELNHSWIH